VVLPALTVEHGADDHLPFVGPVVLAMAILADALAAMALKVERGGVKEHDLDIGKQVAAAAEQHFLDAVLDGARDEPTGALLPVGRQRLAEPAHGAVEVVQFKFVHAIEDIVALAAVGGAVAAGAEQAVQNGEEDGAFDGELEMALTQQFGKDRLTAGGLPEFLEDQGRPPAAGANDRDVIVLDFREDQQFVGEACAGSEQGIDLAVLELVKSAERGEDRLLGPAVAPAIFDDLQIGAGAGFLGAEEHGELRYASP
jgi:hypothetical protein